MTMTAKIMISRTTKMMQTKATMKGRCRGKFGIGWIPGSGCVSDVWLDVIISHH